jgi:vancomycin aglycone glucosyltransferase
MRVLLSTNDSRGGVEPLVALAVRLRELGAEARVCAPPDCAERLAEVGAIRTDGATVAATLLLDRS